MPLPKPLTIAADRAERLRLGVWRFLRFLGADAALADELTQDAFVRLLDADLEDRGDPALASWLRRTAHNLFRATGRQMRREIRTLDPQSLEQGYTRVTAADPTAARHLDALRHCLRTLTARDREALELRHGDRLDRSSLAARLGVTVEGLKSVLRRARERLRICMHARIRNSEEEA